MFVTVKFDSDQSAKRRQRSQYLYTVLLIIVALLLGACAGNSTRMQPEEPPAHAAPSTESPTTIEPRDTRLAIEQTIELDPLIWTRLRSGFRFAQQDFQQPRVRMEIRRLQLASVAFSDLMERSTPYLHHIVNQVEAAGLPSELALLPAVESGFRPYAQSSYGATGLWQFMPATGKMLGLQQDWWSDDRRSVRASTEAALAYLKFLNQQFDGNWLYALAAYNAGAATVQRAIRKAQRQKRPTDYWSLDLPRETNDYIPRLIALVAVVQTPSEFALDLPPIIDQPYFASTPTGGQIDLNVAADLADMEVEDLLELNAGFRRWASRPDGPHQLLLPVDKVDRFVVGLDRLPATKRLRWQRHKIVAGDNLGQIARRYGVSVDAIKHANHLHGSSIRAGKDLLIPLSDSVNLATLGPNHQGRQRLRYRVRKGDSLYTIARRYQVKVADLRRWNQVGRYIRPGEQLTVFVDPDV